MPLVSTRKMFVVVLLLCLFTLGVREVLDPDIWWHLRTGQYIVETRSIPHADIYSSTSLGKQWVTHEWLAEVFIYETYRALGYAGLSMVFAMLIMASFAIVYWRSPGRPYIAGFAVLLAAIATVPIWGARPQVFSLLFTSLFLWVLEQHRRELNARRLWMLFPLMLIWVNLHGGFALGPALIAIFIVGWLLDLWAAEEQRPRAWTAIRQLGAVLVASLAAVLINPNGIRMYSYPLETLRSSAMQAYIVEWFSPNFHMVEYQPLALLMLATFVLLGLSRKRPRASELLLLAVSAYAALRSARHIPVFALIAAPILAEHTLVWVRSRPAANWLYAPERLPSQRRAAFHLAALLLLAMACTLRIRHVVGNQDTVEAKKLPRAAVEFIKAEHLPEPIYNWYNWGGYLIWKLYPDYRVYIDGRADMYGDAFLTEFLGTYFGTSDWERSLDRFQVRTVVVPPDSALASLLRQTPRWTKMFEDHQAVIFTRPSMEVKIASSPHH